MRVPWAAVAEALPDELIIDLARLRWLFVTARGSSFRLRAADADMADIGRLLGVRYASRAPSRSAARTSPSRSSSRTRATPASSGPNASTARWPTSTASARRSGSASSPRSKMRIPQHEAALARLNVSEDLDAWSAYHLGLQHMYRFNRQDNAAATALFQRAIECDPDFARAHAGLSFVHFQTAFLRNTDDLAGEVREARRFAARACELDTMDPFVNFVMGRSYWLVGDLDGGLPWLERATALSPSYAQGIYARAWAETLAGRARAGATTSISRCDFAARPAALRDARHARVHAQRARRGVQAAWWAERAARAPGAHVLIAMIASAMHGLAGDEAASVAWASTCRERNPALTREDFFRSFPIKVASTRARVAGALARRGF